MTKKAPGLTKISADCQRFIKLWHNGVRDVGLLMQELQRTERTIRRWMAQLRGGMLDRWVPVGAQIQPERPGLAIGLPSRAAGADEPDDPESMNPPRMGGRLKVEAEAVGRARAKGKVDDADEKKYGKAPTREELVKLIDEIYGPDFTPDPGPDWDPMCIARQAARDPRVRVGDRLKAVEVCERRRQFDLLHGTSKGKISWQDVSLADIPVEERARLFGLLAEQMQHARAPFLAARETTPEQEAVFFSIGLQVHPEDAPKVLAELEPARDAAIGVAKALTAARQAPPADITPVDAQDYLDHVPG